MMCTYVNTHDIFKIKSFSDKWKDIKPKHKLSFYIVFISFFFDQIKRSLLDALKRALQQTKQKPAVVALLLELE